MVSWWEWRSGRLVSGVVWAGYGMVLSPFCPGKYSWCIEELSLSLLIPGNESPLLSSTSTICKV